MLENTLKQMLAQQFPGGDIHVEMDGNHCKVSIVDEQFDGLLAVKRQQLVYGVLNEKIASGEVHAVHLSLSTASEAQAPF